MKFGPETRELLLNESGPTAVWKCGLVETLNAFGFILPKWTNAQPLDSKDVFRDKLIGLSLKAPSFGFYIVFFRSLLSNLF